MLPLCFPEESAERPWHQCNHGHLPVPTLGTERGCRAQWHQCHQVPQDTRRVTHVSLLSRSSFQPVLEVKPQQPVTHAQAHAQSCTSPNRPLLLKWYSAWGKGRLAKIGQSPPRVVTIPLVLHASYVLVFLLSLPSPHSSSDNEA